MMACSTFEISVTSNLDEFLATIDKAAHYLAAAPDGDAVALAMTAFGEIDMEKHIKMETIKEAGCYRLEISAVPELQRILDMVPAI